MWILSSNPNTPPNQTKQPTKQQPPSYVLQHDRKYDRKLQNLSPSFPVPTPYSNPNLVIRTRRASATVGRNSCNLNNHVSDPCLVSKKINKTKRKSESNGPIL